MSLATPEQVGVLHQGSYLPGFNYKLPNVEGKSLVATVVEWSPGGKTAPHRHGNAFVAAYVISGSVRSQVDDEPIKVYHAGESWHENPGAFHKVSENASNTEKASILAIFVVDSDVKEFVAFDCPNCEVVKDMIARETEKMLAERS